MNARIKLTLIIAVLVVSFVSTTSINTQAISLGDIVKVGGIAVVVDRFGGQINKFINTLTANKNLGTNQATNVVPILSLGGGGYIGAAQVIGTKQNVDNTKAVVQIESNATFGRNLRIKALVPVGSRTTSNIKRIYGVGVSALIDIRI